MFAFTLSLLGLAASNLAMPTLTTRQTGASCTGLPAGSTDSLSYNFTLTAYNLSLPNANDTGAPLVLGWGPPGTSAAASEWVISTYASWGSNDFPYFSLADGALYPIPGPSEEGLGAYDFAISAGDEPAFWVTTYESNPSPAEIYCAVDESLDYALLAVNNDAHHFSLCTVAGGGGGAQNNLVYYPSANSTVYDYDTCYAVRVQLIPYSG